MPSYVSLMNWTDQGVKDFKDSLERYEAAEQAAANFAVKFHDIYWTVGAYDLIAIVEAPDEETVTAFLLAIGAQGNLRTTTLRAFDANEMKGIIAKAS
jgi:uncharacterized protein with GYD domain